MECAIEVKGSEHINDRHLAGLRELTNDYKVKRKIIVSRDSMNRKSSDGIEIVFYQTFLTALWAEDIF